MHTSTIVTNVRMLVFRIALLALLMVSVSLPVAAQIPAPAGQPVLLPIVQLAGSVEATGLLAAAEVLPVDEAHYGHSYGEWAAAWLQWLVQAPPHENPLIDRTGKDCAVNQAGDVWYLAGSFIFDPNKPKPSNLVVRNRCAVPSDKALFFPIINSWFFNDLGWSREQFQPTVVRRVDAVDQLTVTIDGIALTDHLLSYRADSGFFTLHLPEKGYYDTGPKACGPDHLDGEPFRCVGDFDTFIDGYWLMLAPLNAGTHTIHFTAHRKADTTVESDTFFERVLDVTYVLTVQ